MFSYILGNSYSMVNKTKLYFSCKYLCKHKFLNYLVKIISNDDWARMY